MLKIIFKHPWNKKKWWFEILLTFQRVKRLTKLTYRHHMSLERIKGTRQLRVPPHPTRCTLPKVGPRVQILSWPLTSGPPSRIRGPRIVISGPRAACHDGDEHKKMEEKHDGMSREKGGWSYLYAEMDMSRTDDHAWGMPRRSRKGILWGVFCIRLWDGGIWRFMGFDSNL